MKNHLPKIFSLLLFLLNIFNLEAQVNKCALNLIDAREKFNAGLIEEVPGLLLDCIESGFTDEDRIEAYKLLINAYIFDDYPDLAEKFMLQFLNQYPGYKVADNDPFEFVNLFDQFDNHPRYSIGFNIGTNLSMVRVTEPFGVYDLNKVSGDYSGVPGLNISGIFNYYLTPRIELSAEPGYSVTNFKYEVTPFPFTQTEYKEQQGRIDLPLSVLYSFDAKTFSPYLRWGLRGSYLLMSKGESKRSFLDTGGVEFGDIVSDGIDISDRRVPLQLSSFIGGGARYNIHKAYFFVDVRYNFGFTGQVDPASRQDLNDDNIWLYYHIEDDFKLNDLSLTVGFTRVFYNPKRKR